MFEELISKLISGLPTIVAAILVATISSWVTVQLSLKRFRDEKWWEKRVLSYERLIEALHDLKIDVDTSYDAYVEHREVPEDKAEILRAASSDARMELEKVVNMGTFIFSEACHERVTLFLKQARSSSNALDYFTHLDEFSAAISSCLTDVISIAKKDIRKR